MCGRQCVYAGASDPIRSSHTHHSECPMHVYSDDAAAAVAHAGQYGSDCAGSICVMTAVVTA
jgi:hypothetical protein